jgi:hypothetical protein
MATIWLGLVLTRKAAHLPLSLSERDKLPAPIFKEAER